MAKGSKTVPASDCPDDPVEACEWFVEKSVLPWYLWSVHAHLHYHEIGCPDPDEQRPPVPKLTGCEDTADCREVCKRFKDWAKDIRKWAEDFTDAVEGCLNWKATESVPGVPTGRCQDCDEACAAIRAFHADLEKWAKEITDRLNQEKGGPHLVPPPPPPP